MGPRSRAILALLIGAGTVPLLVGTTVPGGAGLILLIVAATGGVALLLRAPTSPGWALPALAILGGGIGAFSIVTGHLNGLSDEPYSTPSYAALGWSLYTRPVDFTYLQYGIPHVERSYYVYLPFLTYLQLPGLDYRWVALGAWAGAFGLLRRDRFAAGGWGACWIPLLAANGQNDFVPLLALTLAIVVPFGRWGWAAEVVALGLKQFANVIDVGVHLLRREYRRALAAVLVTLAILAPFLWIDPGAVYCHVVLGDPTTSCAPHSAGFILFKRNYWLYPTWIGLAFHAPISRWLRARWARWRARRG